MRESELMNNLSDNLGNHRKNIKFVRYIGKFIIFHFPIILESCIGNMKRRARDF